MPRLGTALVYFNAAAPREFCDLCIAHFRLNANVFLTLVHLICDYDYLNVSLAMFLDFGQPHIQVCETLLLEQVEAKDDTFGALVVGVRYSSIALLPRRVPNLQLHLAAAVVN